MARVLTFSIETEEQQPFIIGATIEFIKDSASKTPVDRHVAALGYGATEAKAVAQALRQWALMLDPQ